MTRSVAAIDPWSYYAYTVKSARSEAAFKQRKLQAFFDGKCLLKKIIKTQRYPRHCARDGERLFPGR